MSNQRNKTITELRRDIVAASAMIVVILLGAAL